VHDNRNVSLRRIQVIAGLTLVKLASSAIGYHLAEPLATLSNFSLLWFILFAFDIRKAAGEQRYRAMFSGFAICLLPNYSSDAMVKSAPPEWRAVVGLIYGGFLLWFLWEFSLRGDWSDPNVREKLFSTIGRKRKSTLAA